MPRLYQIIHVMDMVFGKVRLENSYADNVTLYVRLTINCHKALLPFLGTIA